MNIFMLSLDPAEAARLHCDRHVVKMILETCQLLYTAHWMCGTVMPENAYRKTHPNHPSAKWARESAANYRWLCRLGLELCEEYTYRYAKHHKCEEHLAWLCMRIPQGLPEDWTPPKLAMPDEYKHQDPVMAYRTYYVRSKQHLLQYTRRPSPDFLTQAIYMTAVG